MLLGLGAGGSLVVVGPELQLGTMRAADTGTPREQLAKQQTPREPRAAKLRYASSLAAECPPKPFASCRTPILPPARTHAWRGPLSPTQDDRIFTSSMVHARTPRPVLAGRVYACLKS